MRILILSDIHANLVALEAVLAAAEGQWDTIWCLGDIVGYGPNPNECVETLRELDPLSLSGNHDWAVLGRLDIMTFNEDARLAISWTQDALAEESREFLDSLPPNLVEEPFTLAHGSPRQPVWEYIIELHTAAVNFQHFDTDYCLVGHTHTPIVFELNGDNRVGMRLPRYDRPISLSTNRVIINPGSVGQPRDGDPRAAYALLDTEKMTWEHKRVSYDVEETQERMAEYGLPERLIIRLEMGW